MHTHTHTESPVSTELPAAKDTASGNNQGWTMSTQDQTLSWQTHSDLSPHCSKTWRYKRPHKELSLATKYGGAKNRNAIHFQICSYRHCCYALLLSRNRNKTFRTRHRVLQKSSKVFGQNEKRITLHPSSK